MPLTVWTIGHSNRSVDAFVGLLKECKIEVLVDVRSFPTSKIEHFKRALMEKWLQDAGIKYVWLGKELGGYRRGGYVVHMKTDLFKQGIDELLALMRREGVCICCMERDPRHCHRRFISAYLVDIGVKVIHILESGKASLI